MATQTTQTEVLIPDYIQQPTEAMANTLAAAMGQPLNVPAQQVAGFTPTQTAAMQQAYGGIGAYQPYLQAAGTGQQAAMGAMGAGVGALGGMQFDPSGVTPWMDQWQGDVTQGALAEIDRQAAMAQNQLGGQAEQAGAFGGSRFGIQQSELARGAQDLKSKRIFEDMSRNYQQALGAMQAANQQQLQQGQAFGQLGQATSGISGAMAGLGGQAQAMGQSDVNQLMGIGGMQQQLAQAGMTADYQNQLNAMMAPYNQLGWGANIMQTLAPGTGPTAQTVSPMPQSNPYAQGAGLMASMAGGLGSLIGN